MKKWPVIFLILIPVCGHAQNEITGVRQVNSYWLEPSKAQADSLKTLLKTTTDEKLRMKANRELGLYNQEINRFLALQYFEEQLKIAKKLQQPLWEAEALSRIGYVTSLMQKYAEAFKTLLVARDIASSSKTERGIWNTEAFSTNGNARTARLTVLADIYLHLGLVNYFTGDFTRALEYYKEAGDLNEMLYDNAFQGFLWMNRGESYRESFQHDSAKIALNKALQYGDLSGHRKYQGLIYYDLGKISESEKNYSDAKEKYLLCVQSSLREESVDFAGLGFQALADLARHMGATDSSFFYAKHAMNLYLAMNDTVGLISAYYSISFAFEDRGQVDSAYTYLKKSNIFERGLDKARKAKSFQTASFHEQIKFQALETEKLRTQTRIKIWSMVAGIAVLVLVSGILYRSSRRQKRNKLKIEHAYSELKSTQSQLIQSEKMASLGELTAGIAHEIQNPLNFVNNFSEVSKELLDEMKEQLAIGNRQEANEIADDVIQNVEKILHHGKRADGIVKGMLQHSRTSSGQKEPTDINVLADEYLRLAYHGLRAKDKYFNATLKTDYDKSIGKINIIPQDIGRVVLNLINNAFYAVEEKKTLRLPHAAGQASQGDNYEPTVSVSTKMIGDKVLISVKDNGNGISQNVVDKIFQPFFTTKPTGQGTGLGLSLSYDIVKAHGGEININTKEGDGAEFTIQLPV